MLGATMLSRGRLFRTASRLVTLVMLSWTGVCIANPELCALETEGWVFDGVDADAAFGPETPLAPADDEIHVDDCFCCSRHVEPEFAFHVTFTAQPLEEAPATASGEPHAVHRALFRPPQATA